MCQLSKLDANYVCKIFKRSETIPWLNKEASYQREDEGQSLIATLVLKHRMKGVPQILEKNNEFRQQSSDLEFPHCLSAGTFVTRLLSWVSHKPVPLTAIGRVQRTKVSPGRSNQVPKSVTGCAREKPISIRMVSMLFLASGVIQFTQGHWNQVG